MQFDHLIGHFDLALRTVFAPARSHRQTPGGDLPESEMDEATKAHVVGLMRVNHCGEICAQALYQGQALTASDAVVRAAMERAGDEETEHLAWTERRLMELNGRKSLLNPVWYSGALAMGMLAGKFGNQWNLGFLAETERQVEAHLDRHLSLLPVSDMKSRKIVDQMKVDEGRHAEMAVSLGAAELPSPVKLAMKLAARVMTRTAYHL